MIPSPRAIALGLLAALVLSGCATVQRQEAMDAERLLAAAGFQMRPADTPERVAALGAVPALKITAGTKDGQRMYTYADPEHCRCLYVGGPKEYAQYRRLALQEEVATELDSASMNWLLWAPW